MCQNAPFLLFKVSTIRLNLGSIFLQHVILLQTPSTSFFKDPSSERLPVHSTDLSHPAITSQLPTILRLTQEPPLLIRWPSNLQPPTSNLQPCYLAPAFFDSSSTHSFFQFYSSSTLWLRQKLWEALCDIKELIVNTAQFSIFNMFSSVQID